MMKRILEECRFVPDVGLGGTGSEKRFQICAASSVIWNHKGYRDHHREVRTDIT